MGAEKLIYTHEASTRRAELRDRNNDVGYLSAKYMTDKDDQITYEELVPFRTGNAAKIFIRLITESNITDSSTISAIINTSMNIMHEAMVEAISKEFEDFDASQLNSEITTIDFLTHLGALFSDHEMEPEARFCFQKAIGGLHDEDWWMNEMEGLGLAYDGEWQKMHGLIRQNIDALDNPDGGAIQIFGESLEYAILFTFISPSRSADLRNENIDDGNS